YDALKTSDRFRPFPDTLVDHEANRRAVPFGYHRADTQIREIPGLPKRLAKSLGITFGRGTEVVDRIPRVYDCFAHLQRLSYGPSRVHEMNLDRESADR